MTPYSDGVVKIEVRDTKVLSEGDTSDLQVSSVSRCQDSFIFFGTEQVDSVNCAVLFGQLSEVALESWLRCLGTRDLNTLAECLKTLLFPEYLYVSRM
jgi:hypothetical protein